MNAFPACRRKVWFPQKYCRHFLCISPSWPSTYRARKESPALVDQMHCCLCILFCIHVCQNIEPCSLKLPLNPFVSVLLPSSYKHFIVQHLEQTVVKGCTYFKKRKKKKQPPKPTNLGNNAGEEQTAIMSVQVCHSIVVCRMVTHQGRGCMS